MVQLMPMIMEFTYERVMNTIIFKNITFS